MQSTPLQTVWLSTACYQVLSRETGKVACVTPQCQIKASEHTSRFEAVTEMLDDFSSHAQWIGEREEVKTSCSESPVSAAEAMSNGPVNA